jgi:hypothetical protein
MPCRYEKVDGIKPHLKRRAGILKDRASGRVNMVATVSAGEGAALIKLMKRPVNAAFAAFMAHPIPHFHDVIEA